MQELITEMIRRKDGLYDLKITMEGKVLLDVRGIRQKKAHSLIDETQEKVDEE